jgi:hypothetical protein
MNGAMSSAERDLVGDVFQLDKVYDSSLLQDVDNLWLWRGGTAGGGAQKSATFPVGTSATGNSTAVGVPNAGINTSAGINSVAGINSAVGIKAVGGVIGAVPGAANLLELDADITGDDEIGVDTVEDFAPLTISFAPESNEFESPNQQLEVLMNRIFESGVLASELGLANEWIYYLTKHASIEEKSRSRLTLVARSSCLPFWVKIGTRVSGEWWHATIPHRLRPWKNWRMIMIGKFA